MSDLNFHLGKGQADSFKIAASATEVHLTENRKGDHFQPINEQSKQFLIVFALIAKFLKQVEDHQEELKFLSQSESILYHLKQFKITIDQLKEEDLSQELSFALRLSKSWNAITDYIILMPKSKKNHSFFLEGSLLIESINLYPQEEEHTLGFYLSHYAGQDWLPFPFMKMIQQLHEEQASNPASSHLEIWSNSLARLIEFFTQTFLSES